jgi:hypothetical protein
MRANAYLQETAHPLSGSPASMAMTFWAWPLGWRSVEVLDRRCRRKERKVLSRSGMAGLLSPDGGHSPSEPGHTSPPKVPPSCSLGTFGLYCWVCGGVFVYATFCLKGDRKQPASGDRWR